ncbi:MAG: tRNA lysidine(34) synthetase TilS [Actinomycetaceae bacterium]|nr:tRNA lysidine(34) synthetase TilS [Actinomycetaceae bacterium]
MDNRRPRAPHPAIAAARLDLSRLLESCPPQAPLIVGVSGGSDSMALALVAQYVARHEERECACVIVDHGMRRESYDEAIMVADRLRNLDFGDVQIVPVELAGNGGLEAAARTARYAALAKVASERGGVVLLGHTADDQAETVLLGLARGSGARSLAGMPELGALGDHSDICVVRPLLAQRRMALREALSGMGIAWVDDPTNEPDSAVRAADGHPLRRNAIRHQGIPGLNRALRMSVIEPLARTASLIRRDNEALDSWASEQYEKLARCDADFNTGQSSVRFSIPDLADLPIAIRTRVLRMAAIDVGAKAGALNFWHIEHMSDLVTGEGRVRGHRSIDLPSTRDGWRSRARQDEGELVIETVETISQSSGL